jgi:hypothetical protein
MLLIDAARRRPFSSIVYRLSSIVRLSSGVGREKEEREKTINDKRRTMDDKRTPSRGISQSPRYLRRRCENTLSPNQW